MSYQPGAEGAAFTVVTFKSALNIYRATSSPTQSCHVNDLHCSVSTRERERERSKHSNSTDTIQPEANPVSAEDYT